MKKILIDEDQVSTLAELAAELAKSHGWESYEVGTTEIRFVKDGVKGVVDLGGFAQKVPEDEENSDFEDWDEENIDWDEEFDAWSNHVWAEDEDGNTVMLHD